MEGVEHLGQYVFEMTRTRIAQLRAERGLSGPEAEMVPVVDRVVENGEEGGEGEGDAEGEQDDGEEEGMTAAEEEEEGGGERVRPEGFEAEEEE
jgi:intron-binding protein aquarius